MYSEDLAGIERLPEYAGNIGRSVVQAADRLFYAGLAKKAPFAPVPIETYFLNPVRFDWSFFVVKKANARIFFFFQRNLGEKALVSAKVSLVFRLREIPSETLAAGPQLLTYYYILPPFIPRFTTQADIDAYGPEADALVTPDCENTLTIALGEKYENILSVLKPSSRYDARLRYTPREGPTLEFKGEDKWPVAVVIELTETLRKWAQKQFRKGTILEFTPSYSRKGPTSDEDDKADEDDKNDVVHSVIQQISLSYAEALRVMMQDNSRIFGCLPEESGLGYGLGYGIDEFNGTVKLRLNKDGELSDADKDGVFHLNLGLAVEQEKTGANVLVSIGPPDFLVTGDNRQCFLDTLKREDRVMAEIREQIREICADKTYAQIFGETKIQIDANEIRRFIETAEEDSVVFRILQEKKKDTDVIFLKSDFCGIPFYMILCAEFRKNPAGSAAGAALNVELVRDSLKVLYFLPSSHKKGEIKNQQVGIYLLRLLLNIHRWIEILD